MLYILDSGLYSLGVYNVCFIYWTVGCLLYILDSGLYSLGVYNVCFIYCVLYILDSGLYSLGVYNVYFIYWTVGCIYWEHIMQTGYINYCRSEHAESFSNMLSDMVTDDTLSPTDMLPLPLLYLY